MIAYSSTSGVTFSSIDITLEDVDTEVDFGTVSELDKFKPGDQYLEDANIPAWLIWIWSLIDGLWLVLIGAGWVRGTS